ncbi:MAG: hypothetical protein GX625_15385 [Clostridiaceae bacterium]|nr:hypothetical protein [Clostridiaceae bacterium]
MHQTLSDEERARAVQCIIANVSETTLQQIYTEISNDPDWLILHHFFIGADIRNLFRINGFNWDDVTLDREWEPITFTAVRMVSENTQ